MAVVVQHTSISMQFLCLASRRNNRNVRWQELTYHDGLPTFAFSYGLKGSYRIQNIFAYSCEFLGLFGSYLEAVVFIFWGFSEDFRRFSKDQKNFSKHFPEISGQFPMITKYCRRLLRTTEEDPKMFRSYIGKTFYIKKYETKIKTISSKIKFQQMFSIIVFLTKLILSGRAVRAYHSK